MRGSRSDACDVEVSTQTRGITMACSGRGDSILFMILPATWLAWFRAAPLKPSVGRLIDLFERLTHEETLHCIHVDRIA